LGIEPIVGILGLKYIAPWLFCGKNGRAAVTEKTRNEIINEAQHSLRACRLCAALHGFGECG
jgi:hypothetical protein